MMQLKKHKLDKIEFDYQLVFFFDFKGLYDAVFDNLKFIT